MNKALLPTLLLLCGAGLNLLCGSIAPAEAKGSLLRSSKYKMRAPPFPGPYLMDVDSVRYTYSGGRNGDLKNPGGILALPFDSSISYPYTVNVSQPIASGISVKHFNAVGLVDTETNYWSTRTIRVFNAAGKPTQCDFQNGNPTAKTWGPGQRQFRYYNVAGLDSLHHMMIWNAATSTWKDDNRTNWSYNAAGKITQMTLEMWNTMSAAWDGQLRATNNYNGAGLLADDKTETWSTSTSSWTTAQIRFYTYSGGFMTKQITERYFNSVINGVDSTYYTSSGSPVVTTIASTYTKTGATGTYRPSQRITTVTNPAGNLNAHIWESGGTGGWANYQYVYFSYNSDNQLTRQYMETWDGNGWAYQPTVSYEMLYYYGSPTGITANPGSKSAGIELGISPVPASGSISVHLTLRRPQGFEASITDMTGRQLRSWTSLATTASHTESVAINDLAPGVYHLNVESREGTETRAFIVR